jgi:hypothetical protein
LSKSLDQSPYESLIQADIHRVLTTIKFESGDGPQLLFNVLKAFTLYERNVGYSQELAYVAGVLLLQLEEEVNLHPWFSK